jgi:hypothetical protein
MLLKIFNSGKGKISPRLRLCRFFGRQRVNG